MLLRGAVLKPRTLNEMDTELMRRHATIHDRINGLSWKEPPRNGSSEGYNFGGKGASQSFSDGNTQGRSQHMRWFPPPPPPPTTTTTPGIPPSNIQASQWYQQTSTTYSSAVSSDGHSSGIMRLEDLQTYFRGSGGYSRGGYSGGRGYYSQDRRSGGGSGYYQGHDDRYSGSGYR